MNGPEGVVELSPAGTGRREAILGAARGALRARRRRRAALRATAVVVPVVAVVLAVVGLSGRSHWGVGSEAAIGRGTSGLVLRNVVFEQVRTEPGVAERAAAMASGRASIDLLDDDQLLQELRDAGRPTGIIRSEGHIVLTERVAANDPEPTGDEREGGAAGDQGHG